MVRALVLGAMHAVHGGECDFAGPVGHDLGIHNAAILAFSQIPSSAPTQFKPLCDPSTCACPLSSSRGLGSYFAEWMPLAEQPFSSSSSTGVNNASGTGTPQEVTNVKIALM
jgi:hypothetical protein